MEFPNLGSRCSWHTCKILDFLPFTCSYCTRIYCKDHYNQNSHECESYKTEISKNSDIKSFVCSFEKCTTCCPVELLCTKCQKHFCLLHRYHDCFDNIDDIEQKIKIYNEPKEKFNESIKVANSTVNNSIRKALQDPKKQATALKIQLMKLKGKAEGSSSIPTTERIYFLVFLPKGSKKSSKPIFISKTWSVGRVIDSVSNLCDISNKNNELNCPKLRLFKSVDGTQISPDTSVKIEDLLNKNVIVNGDYLIFEYVNPNADLNNFILENFSEYSE